METASIIKYRWLILLNLFLVSPVVIDRFIGPDAFSVRNLAALGFFLTVSLAFLALFHALIRRAFYAQLVLIPLHIATVIELYLLANYQTRLTASYINIVVGDFSHASEFMQIISPGLWLAGFAGLGIFGFAMVKIFRLHFEVSMRCIVVTLLIFGVLFGSRLLVYANKFYGPESLAELLELTMFYDHSVPLGTIGKFIAVQDIVGQNRKIMAARQNFRFGAKRNRAGQREIHVIVLGESARPDHWQLGGYPRATNPELSKLENLIFVDDITSEIALTSISVPLILTRSEVGIDILDDRSVSPERSIVSAFSEVGFKTHWLSTVSLDQTLGDITNISAEADHLVVNEWDFDQSLLTHVDDLLRSNRNDDLFIVLHTQGSHFLYHKRYPDQFEIFTPAGAGEAREVLVNSYDNSIVYTDHLMAQLIRMLEAQQTITSLLYVSDHGENLKDDDRQLYFHVINNEYDIPTTMFFWYSDQLAEAIPDKIDAFEQNARTTRVSTASVFPTILDIGGIEIPEYTADKSLLNTNLRPYTRYFLRNSEPENFDRWLDDSVFSVKGRENPCRNSSLSFAACSNLRRPAN